MPMHATILALASMVGSELVVPELVVPGGSQPRLGSALALDGRLLAAGAPDAHRPAARAGAVALWEEVEGSWRLTDLFVGDGRAGERFGASLDLEDGRLAVGAYFADGPVPRTGAVHIFEDGTREARLVPPDAEEFDGFGWSVALDGDRLLVGAPFADRAGFQSGGARVYVRLGRGWVLQDTLLPSGLGPFDHLGHSVAWCGGLALVGAPGSDLVGTDRGAVFVFEWTGSAWLERAPLVAPDLPLGAGLGRALAAEGRRALAGAPGSGSVRIWCRRAGAWEVEATLAGKPSSLFGAAVALDGALLAVGAPKGQGSIHVHARKRDRWVPEMRLSGDGGTLLGVAVAVRGDGLAAAGVPLGGGGCQRPCRGGRVEVWGVSSPADAW